MIQIKKQPMGEYQTNCYIATLNNQDFIIDPGVGAAEWVQQNVSNPIAILNTHGHFDHVWSNAQLQKELNIPIYTPKDDIMFLSDSTWRPTLPPSSADFQVTPDETIDFNGTSITFHHFPGHTPGCSMIEIDNAIFSGDFIFKRSIGRYDFPYSSPSDMKKSLLKFKEIQFDKIVYPGHGEETTIKEEQKYIEYWLRNL